MFTTEQLTNALNAYGTNASAHVARLIALADMRETDGATIEDIAVAIRHAAACSELGLPFDDTSAGTVRAAERMTGYSDSTFARYSVVLEWIALSLGDNETLPAILADNTFTPAALSALCQLASGKVAPRKVAADTVSGHIAKRNSDKIVAAYRRLLAASNAKAKAKRERAAREESAKTVTVETAAAAAAAPTVEEILAELTIPAMAELLLARIAANVEELTADDYAALVDTIKGIDAMLDETEDN